MESCNLVNDFKIFKVVLAESPISEKDVFFAGVKDDDNANLLHSGYC